MDLIYILLLAGLAALTLGLTRALGRLGGES